MSPRILGLGLPLVISACLGMARAADTNSAREYREAVAAHEQATAAENKRYQDKLNELIRRAQAEGDADTLARLKAALAALPARPQATATPGPQMLKPDFLGQWHLQIVYRSGRIVRFTMDIRPDGTWSYERTYSGTWKVADDYLNVYFKDDLKALDRYSLPGNSGELRGKNVNGETLILSRQAPTPAGGSPSPSYFGTQ